MGRVIGLVAAILAAAMAAAAAPALAQESAHHKIKAPVINNGGRPLDGSTPSSGSYRLRPDSSPTPGHAMRSDGRLPGTILGKAMEPLDRGTGAVKVLVMLR